ncbi:LPS export ABC transporter periplasmic protein LptC [Pseudomonas stutzeri]|nr:LPS export ABC transporter periplasmic protein LptC [Stutzerimonas stutzeri]
MSPTLRTFLPFALLAALLVAIGYWNIRPESFLQGSAPATDDPVDFYAENARSVQFQTDGRLHYRMRAERLEHRQDSDVTHLTRPELLLHRGSDYPWQVRSERGAVSPGGVQVDLIDAVRIERSDAKGRPTVLTTSHLSVFPEREYAETDQPVRIEAANGVTTASGLQAYFNESRMLLKSNVRGQHEVR